MKKDRNCGGTTPYPVYPMYSGAMPGPIPMTGVNMPMPINAPTWTTQGFGSTQNYTDSEINTLSNQVNSLEQRVSNLENMINKIYSNNYNSSNFQMM